MQQDFVSRIYSVGRGGSNRTGVVGVAVTGCPRRRRRPGLRRRPPVPNPNPYIVDELEDSEDNDSYNDPDDNSSADSDDISWYDEDDTNSLDIEDVNIPQIINGNGDLSENTTENDEDDDPFDDN